MQAEPDFQNVYFALFTSMLDDPSLDFGRFEQKVEEFLARAKDYLKIRERGITSSRKNRNLPDVNDYKTIQKLYRNNQWKALRVILGNDADFCDLDPAEVASHYAIADSVCDSDTGYLTDYTRAQSTVGEDMFTRREVKNKLFSCENTSPGPNGISYKGWRTVDPEDKVFTVIYNICKSHKKIPGTWKDMNTILIFKKGDRTMPSNWRPIALGNTIYKL